MMTWFNYLCHRTAVAVVCAAITCSSAIAETQRDPELRRFPQARITITQWREFRKELMSNVDAVVVERKYTTRIVLQGDNAIYIFTKVQHAAHPAAVRRAVVTDGKKVYVHTSGYYAGNRAAFAIWLEMFQGKDRELKRRLQEDHQHQAYKVLVDHSL